jgi:hypothetical protein
MADVFDELLIEDHKILQELDNAEQGHKAILDIFARRITMYKKFADKQHDSVIKAIIEGKKSVIMSDMVMLSSQYNIQTNIAEITTRLDGLEKKIHKQLKKLESVTQS